MQNSQVSNYYQDVNKLILELKEAKKQLSKLGAALDVASRKLGIPGEDLLKLEAQPQEPSPKELTEEQKHEYYFKEELQRFYQNA